MRNGIKSTCVCWLHRFEFLDERAPIQFICCHLRGLLVLQCLFQPGSVCRERFGKQPAFSDHLLTPWGVMLGDSDQDIGRTRFTQPEYDPLVGRFVTKFVVVPVHQTANHRPILVSLRFLRFHQVFDTEQFVDRSALIAQCRSAFPKLVEFVTTPHSCHHIQANVHGIRMLASEMNRVPC